MGIDENAPMPQNIVVDYDVFDLDFHPSQDVVALGTITGNVQVYVLSMPSQA